MARSGWLCSGLRPRTGTSLTRVGRMVLTGKQMPNKASTTAADLKDHKSTTTLLTNGTVTVKRKELQTSVVNLDFALYFEISLATASPYDYAFKMAQRGRRSVSITERRGGLMYFPSSLFWDANNTVYRLLVSFQNTCYLFCTERFGYSSKHLEETPWWPNPALAICLSERIRANLRSRMVLEWTTLIVIIRDTIIMYLVYFCAN